MAEIGRADLVIVPRFDGLSSSINRALGGVDMQQGGSKMGASLGASVAGGMAKSIVAGNIITGAIEQVTGFIADHMDDAVSRLDTMKNYGIVMQNLGFGADAAEASIQKMSDRLQNLPTTLDSMVGTVQGLSVITGDLDKATDAGLALNDMLLASGSNTQLVSAAAEQFRQMLSKGKPDMQDWKSLVQTAPAQMQQLAKAMLGTTATTNDLYAALGGGGVDPTITMDELLDTMVRLDSEGGGGLASFQRQAESATGGIDTAMKNMGNAVTKGIANVMDAVGRDNISGAFNGIRDGITVAFGGIANGVDRIRDGWTRLTEGFNPSDNRISAAIQTIVGDLGQVPGAAEIAAQSFEWLNQRAAADYERASQAQTDYYARRQDHAAQSERIAAAYSEESGKLAYAEGVLDRYANKTNLSASEQAIFAKAIETVNELCGTNYSVVDASAGAYANEAGEIQNNTDAIKRNIEQRRNASKADAFGKEVDETEKDYAQAIDTMGKWQTSVDSARDSLSALYEKYGTNDLKQITEEISRNLSSTDTAVQANAGRDFEVIRRWNDAVHSLSDSAKDARDHAKAIDELTFAQYAMQKAASGAELSLSEMAGASQIVQAAFTGEGSKAALSMADFSTAIEACAVNGDRLKQVLNDPNQLEGMIQAYDGTAESLRGFFEQAGIGWNDEAARQIDAKNRTDELRASLEGMRYELESAAQSNMGMGFDQLTEQLANANISADTLSTMGLPALSTAMAESGGQMDALIAIINTWNQSPMYDKQGNVDVTGISTLRDAQGKVYTWNGTELRDQNGTVVVDTVDLEDAQGKKMTWNGTNLEDKSGSGTIGGNMSEGIAERDNWNAVGLADHIGSGIINITRSITETVSSIVGGHASGGFRGEPRFHANGGIAHRAVPLDIVGEDGAEAIVPLTNRKYAMPFVNMIANEIGRGGKANVTANFYVTAASDPEAFARQSMRAVVRLARSEG